MSFITYIKLALAFMQFANWCARQVDEHTWRKSGYQEAAADQLKEFNTSVGLAKEAALEARRASPEDRRGSLRDP